MYKYPLSEMFITGKFEGKFSNDETCILEPDQNQNPHIKVSRQNIQFIRGILSPKSYRQ